jgi:hypothetical protein
MGFSGGYGDRRSALRPRYVAEHNAAGWEGVVGPPRTCGACVATGLSPFPYRAIDSFGHDSPPH